ncbi:glycolate oxidase [Austwickia chelonae]|uniref:Putative FAD-linked oxidase n=1 Tax=Austwickia chelonae NBRC 105200 TaxID=1184607 RepID=K6V585_9MICO|nr:FAD-linked oxidase C-terminal domain-containing protein [Austwickia chelonae]GAB77373.1 putative FAD-linked oxidase [Austwickia chelonae NBRC 105200]SEW08961.1 glycolate oxidase [Austwickia chelonae]
MIAASLASLPGLVFDPVLKATYGVDASFGAVAPTDFEVVRASDVQDVVEAVRYADAHHLALVPQGARTALTDAASAVEGCLVLNTEGLNTIEEIDEVEGIAVVGAGVVTGRLRQAVAEKGLFYPPDPGSVDTCTLGGNVAMNAGGMCCVKYGVTADYVRGLEVVLPDGQILRTGRRTAKGVTGLDMTGLFVGSEGTLGVVTRVVTKLVPAPDPALTVLGTFDSLEAASRAIVALRSISSRPSMLEFLDGPSIATIQALQDFGFPRGCAAALLVQSDRPGHAGEDVAEYARIMRAHDATSTQTATDLQESERLLAGRRSLNTAQCAYGPHLIEDMCVPVRRLPDLVRAGEQISLRHGLQIMMAGHGGDGNLHPAIFFDPSDAEQSGRAWQAFDDLIEAALALGGTLAGEHGVGSLKAPWLRREIGDLSYGLQQQMKSLFDPKGIMNPGRVYETRPHRRGN